MVLAGIPLLNAFLGFRTKLCQATDVSGISPSLLLIVSKVFEWDDVVPVLRTAFIYQPCPVLFDMWGMIPKALLHARFWVTVMHFADILI
jgi:hypothetical protein